MPKRWPWISALLIAFLALVETTAATTPAPPKKPLFQRLGGKAQIRKATDHFLTVLTADTRLMKNPELRQLTKSLKREKLVRELTERVCAVSGGPCEMTAGTLDKLGPDLEISALEWGYLLHDLNQTLAKFKIPRREQAEFVGIVLKNQTGAAR